VTDKSRIVQVIREALTKTPLASDYANEPRRSSTRARPNGGLNNSRRWLDVEGALQSPHRGPCVGPITSLRLRRGL
jgi:hypothetical protein